MYVYTFLVFDEISLLNRYGKVNHRLNMREGCQSSKINVAAPDLHSSSTYGEIHHILAERLRGCHRV